MLNNLLFEVTTEAFSLVIIKCFVMYAMLIFAGFFDEE